MDEDLEQLLLGFDAIRSAQAVPPRWSAEWDERLKRGHEVCAVYMLACVNSVSVDTFWFFFFAPSVHHTCVRGFAPPVPRPALLSRRSCISLNSWHGLTWHGMARHDTLSVSGSFRRCLDSHTAGRMDAKTPSVPKFETGADGC